MHRSFVAVTCFFASIVCFPVATHGSTGSHCSGSSSRPPLNAEASRSTARVKMTQSTLICGGSNGQEMFSRTPVELKYYDKLQETAAAGQIGAVDASGIFQVADPNSLVLLKIYVAGSIRKPDSALPLKPMPDDQHAGSAYLFAVSILEVIRGQVSFPVARAVFFSTRCERLVNLEAKLSGTFYVVAFQASDGDLLLLPTFEFPHRSI